MLNNFNDTETPNSSISDLAKALDINKDGKIDFNEFLEAFRLVNNSIEEQSISFCSENNWIRHPSWIFFYFYCIIYKVKLESLLNLWRLAFIFFVISLVFVYMKNYSRCIYERFLLFQIPNTLYNILNIFKTDYLSWIQNKNFFYSILPQWPE